MSKMYYGSIDLTKIDKSKIITTDKEGRPFKNGGKFLNVTLWINDGPDQYGNDAAIQMSQTKAEREAGNKAVYLGNLKENRTSKVPHPVEDTESSGDVDEFGQTSDDLPF